MSNFKIGVEYKFANEDAEDEASRLFAIKALEGVRFASV